MLKAEIAPGIFRYSFPPLHIPRVEGIRDQRLQPRFSPRTRPRGLRPDHGEQPAVHGFCRSAEDMAADIDTRLRYLALLRELREGFTAEQVEALCGVKYDYLDAHQGNVRAVSAAR